MGTKKVTVDQKDADEVTKAQVITGNVNGVLQFAASEPRVKIQDGTKLEVMDSSIRGGGASNPEYYYIADVAFNKQERGDFRRYFIKKEDTR